MIRDYSRSLFCIIGLPQHGKTEVAKVIAQALGFQRASTSDVIFDALAAQYAKATKRTQAECLEMLRQLPKESLRAELIRVGDDLTKNDPAFLVKTLIQRGCRVIDGIRRRAELKAARSIPGVETDVWWVRRNPAPFPISDNTQVTADDADFIILNQYPDVARLRDGVLQIILK